MKPVLYRYRDSESVSAGDCGDPRMTTDTKSYWKRRALKAEAEVKTWRDIRAVDNSMEMALVAQNAALRTAIVEIREALDGLAQCPTREE